MRVSSRAAAAALVLAAVSLSACDTAASGDAAPDVIAPAAFDLGADAFPDAKATGANFANAAVRVGVVSTVIGLHLVLPSAATHAATRAEPFVTDDGVWVWETTVDVLGTPVDIRLEGEPRGRETGWRLSTASGDEAPFTLYTARTRLDGRAGTWALFSREADGPVLRAEFDTTSDRGEVTFSVPEGRDNGGSSVLYESEGPARVFDWLDLPEDDRALIEWDAETGAGSIEADTYREGERACWDASLADAACAAV